MTLAITATPAGSLNEQMKIDVTGAAAYTSAYASDFGTSGSPSADSWSHIGAYYYDYGDGENHPYLDTSLAGSTAARTVTGLTIGHNYELRMVLGAWSDNVLTTVGIDGIGTTDSELLGWNREDHLFIYQFEATGTSHVIEINTITDAMENSGSLSHWSQEIVSVNLLDLASSTAAAITIIRDGSLYFTGTVRQPEGSVPNASGALTIYDEEFTFGENGEYGVVLADGTAVWSSVVSPADRTDNLLAPVGFIGHSISIPRIDVFDETNDFTKASNVLTIIGRQEPISISGEEEDEPSAWQLRSGTIQYWAANYDDARDIVDLYTDGRVMALRNSQVGILYHIATSIEIAAKDFVASQGTPTGSWTWAVSVKYQEVNNPDSTLQGAFGYAYKDVLEDYLAYWNLPLEFSTYADLAAGS